MHAVLALGSAADSQLDTAEHAYELENILRHLAASTELQTYSSRNNH